MTDKKRVVREVIVEKIKSCVDFRKGHCSFECHSKSKIYRRLNDK